MRLLNLNAYAALFDPLCGKRVGYVPMPGNCGDQLIELATMQLFAEFRINYTIHKNKSPGSVDVFVIAGGGSMGGYYIDPRRIRERILTFGKPVIVFPQTFLGPEPLPYSQVFVREKHSLRFCPDAALAPDLALGLDYECQTVPTQANGIFLRKDKEGCFSWADSDGDPSPMCPTPEAYLQLAAEYENIVTDRLHFAIAGLICGRCVTLLPNAYFKNRAVWETWLEELGCQWSDRLPE